MREKSEPEWSAISEKVSQANSKVFIFNDRSVFSGVDFNNSIYMRGYWIAFFHTPLFEAHIAFYAKGLPVPFGQPLQALLHVMTS